MDCKDIKIFNFQSPWAKILKIRCRSQMFNKWNSLRLAFDAKIIIAIG